jgi:hypothetical protein
MLTIATCSLGVAAEAAEIMCMGYVLPLIEFKDIVAMRSDLSAAVCVGLLALQLIHIGDVLLREFDLG